MKMSHLLELRNINNFNSWKHEKSVMYKEYSAEDGDIPYYPVHTYREMMFGIYMKHARKRKEYNFCWPAKRLIVILIWMYVLRKRLSASKIIV